MSRRRAWVIGLVACCLALVDTDTAFTAFPGSNGQIAYSRFDGTDGEIYTSNLDGSGEVAITNNASGEGFPAWSADGSRVAFTSDRDGNGEIYVMNAGGSGQTRITTNAADDYNPHWSPDGTRIVFVSKRDDPNFATCFYCNTEIYVINADGTGETRLTTYPGRDDYPVWSPDGSKIAFSRIGNPPSSFGPCIYTMNADGSGEGLLPTAACIYGYGDASDPDWSPDGQKVTFVSSYQSGAEESVDSINSINADGTGEQELFSVVKTFGASTYLSGPVWSPDGTRIAFACYDELSDTFNRCEIFSGGSGATVYPGLYYEFDWQPILPTQPGYARPISASPTSVKLVPAYKTCASANSTHNGPLSGPSCNPPQQTSDYLTVGTPDANGAGANSTGFVKFHAICHPPDQNGIPECPAPGDQIDIALTASLTDVRNKSDLTDYTGELRVSVDVRITDRYNLPGGVSKATAADTPFSFSVPCQTTAGASIGSMCSTSTSADALIPGIALEGKRAVWQLSQVQVYDGGADGDADTTGDNTLFAVQGLFAP